MKLKRVKFNRFVEVEPKPASAVQSVTNVGYDLEYDCVGRCVYIASKSTGRVVVADLTGCEWEPDDSEHIHAIAPWEDVGGEPLRTDIGAQPDEPQPAGRSPRRTRKGKPKPVV